jgi:hypothetical protein
VGPLKEICYRFLELQREEDYWEQYLNKGARNFGKKLE